MDKTFCFAYNFSAFFVRGSKSMQGRRLSLAIYLFQFILTIGNKKLKQGNSILSQCAISEEEMNSPVYVSQRSV